MKENIDDSTQKAKDRTAGEMSESEIDDNLEDTFPASDPPSWTLGSNHHSDLQEPESDDVKED